MTLRQLFDHLEKMNDVNYLLGENEKIISLYIDNYLIYKGSSNKEMQKKVKEEFIKDYAKGILNAELIGNSTEVYIVCDYGYTIEGQNCLIEVYMDNK